MKAVAYCRVSTSKGEQLDSLESQQQFFTEYAKRGGYDLIQIYADEGKSGTRMKNRTQLLRLLSDADRGRFGVVLIKDVSRLARNTVDFLTSIRRLKQLGIRVLFVNYDQTSSDSSEFMLTMLSAIAQEESANTSKRVKFGKKMNAEKGKVPNFVYGYDKVPGDYFTLHVNSGEAEVVRRIFEMYTGLEIGAGKIAKLLNSEGLRTRRGCAWSQNAISRILDNQIYIGNVVNGKEEVTDFLTGKRKQNNSADFLIVHRPELRIVDDKTFCKAKQLATYRNDNFQRTRERSSDKHLFSKLIRCTCCGSAFRRQVREYQNIYIKWICAGRNANGTAYCKNKTALEESAILDGILRYFAGILKDKPKITAQVTAECKRQLAARGENETSEKGLTARLNKLKNAKRKYMEMYEAEVITLEELKAKTKEQNAEIDKLAVQIEFAQSETGGADPLDESLAAAFSDIRGPTSKGYMTRDLFARVIERIEVGECGGINVYFKPIKEIEMENTVLLSYNQT